MCHVKPPVLRFIAVISLLSAPLPAMGAAVGKVIDVTKSGVVGDGKTLNTVAIQKAIDDCARWSVR